MNAQKRILVVDDDVTAAHVLRQRLEQTARFEVRVESNSAHALATIRDYQPDLVVLDICMPDKPGGDIAAEMRADSRLRHVPVVFLTSIVSEREVGPHPLRSGGSPLLAKPVNMSKLLPVLDHLLVPDH